MNQTVDYAFLHGGGQGSWVWTETLAALRQQTNGRLGRTLALDIPGCGEKRGRDTANLGPDDVAAELLSDLSNAGMKDIVLVGHSQAGNVMPLLVESRPDLFRRLVYISCSSPLPGQTVPQMMGTGRHGSSEHEVGWPGDGWIDDIQSRYRLMFCSDMNDVETSAFLAKLDRDAWPERIYGATGWRYDHLGAVPSTFVICLKDGILPIAWQEKFAARFKVERCVRIDAGHQVMNTRPHTLAEILRHEASLA